MSRGDHQNICRPRQARERIVLLALGVQRDINGHLAFVFEINAAGVQHIGGALHLFRPLGNRIAEGREADESNPRLKPHVTRDLSPFFGNVGQILFVWPFVHQRIADKYDPPLVQQRGNADGAMLGVGVEHVVQPFKHMRRFTRRTGHQTIAMPMCQHQCGEHVTIPRGQTVNVFAVRPFTLQPVVKI